MYAFWVCKPVKKALDLLLAQNLNIEFFEWGPLDPGYIKIKPEDMNFENVAEIAHNDTKIAKSYTRRKF